MRTCPRINPASGFRIRARALLVAFSVATAAIVVLPAQPASAATFSVRCGDVYGSRGLVAAITAANHSGQPSVINLFPSCTYVLTRLDHNDATCLGVSTGRGLPAVTGTLTINGAGATIARAAGAPEFGILAVRGGGDLTLNRLTVANGKTTVEGGIVNAGHLTLDSVTVRNNTTTCAFGGGLHNFGTAVVRNSRIVDNTAATSIPDNGSFGGGIENEGTLTVTGSAIDNNTAITSDPASVGFSEGGGLANFGTATLSNSTVDNNRAVDTRGSGTYSFAAGGGIHSDGNGLTLDHTQVAGNATVASGTSLGGGISNQYGTATLVNQSTVTRNTAGDGGGIYVLGGSVALTTGSTVTANTPNNCAPPGSVAGCVG